ncbi:hemin receptor [Spirochaetia bacterium]|nr:hemin receptor [Spirochaetia bacterium]
MKSVYMKKKSMVCIWAMFFVMGMITMNCEGKNGGDVRGDAGVNILENTNENADSKTDRFWKTEQRPDGEYLIDREGNTIPLKQYRRIVLLSPGAVETLYLIGGESAIAAIASSSESVWPAEKTILLPGVGNVARPNLETMISMEPDLVIGNSMNSGFIRDYISRGNAAIVHGADSIEDIFYSALILGRLCGREEAAKKLVSEKQIILASLAGELREQPLGLKGAFLFSANPLMAFNSASLAGNVLEVLGAQNIAADLPASQPILSSEYVLAQNPDFLFGAMSITKPEDILAADSAILKTRAGRESNISIVPSSFFLRPSPRMMDKLLELHSEMKKYRQDWGEKNENS